MKRYTTNYTFTPGAAGAGTIKSTEFKELARIGLIVNSTTNTVIYDIGDSAVGGTLVGETLTLDSDTSAMSATDKLLITLLEGTADWKWSFAKVVAGGVDADFGAIVGTVGTGMAVSQSAGNLVLTTGTTAYSETIIRSNNTFDPLMFMRYSLTLSQRIANNNFAIELTDVIGDNLTMTIGSTTSVTVTKTAHGFTASDIGKGLWIGKSSVASVPTQRGTIASITDANNFVLTVAGFPASGTGTCSIWGYNYHQVLYNGTTITGLGGGYTTQRLGWSSNSAATISSTTAGHIGTINAVSPHESFFLDAPLVQALTATTHRATAPGNVPELVPLYLQIRAYNGSTAPASTTTMTVGFVAVSAHDAQKVAITSNAPTSTNNLLPTVGITSVTSMTAGVVTNATLVAGTVAGATLGIATTVADVASAAIIATTTTAAFTPTAGLAYQIVIPVTVVTGTNPLMTVMVEESADGGTNWYPRFPTPFVLSTTQSGTTTGTGIYYLPILLATGNRVRYVQTITGTSPSITRSIGRNQLQHATSTGMQYQLISAASTNSTLVKAGPTLITALTGSNVNAAVRYLKLYDKATAPTVGTDPVAYTFMLPGSTTGGGSNVPLANALYFARGCGIGLTTGATVADTGAVAANEHIINCQVS